MFISQKEKEFVKKELGNLWNNTTTLYRNFRDIKDKIEALFVKDCHGTIRPKVDMLGDVVDRTVMSAIGKVNTNMWIEVNKLNERIDKLEKK